MYINTLGVTNEMEEKRNGEKCSQMADNSCVRLFAPCKNLKIHLQAKKFRLGLLAIAASHSRFRWINTIPLHKQFYYLPRNEWSDQWSDHNLQMYAPDSVLGRAHLKYTRSCRVTFRKLFNRWGLPAWINVFPGTCLKKCLLYGTRIILISNMESLSICCTNATTTKGGFANAIDFMHIICLGTCGPRPTTEAINQ